MNDPEMIVTIQCRVLTTEWRDDPTRDAEDMIREALRPHVHSEWDWNNRYIIIIADTPGVVVEVERVVTEP